MFDFDIIIFNTQYIMPMPFYFLFYFVVQLRCVLFWFNNYTSFDNANLILDFI